MVCKKLEDMDFKNISNSDLFEYIYSLDNIQGRKFRRLEGDALETSRVGIIRHLMSCLSMDVRPDPSAMREIMEDALKGKAEFDRIKAQSRINSFRREDPDILQRREENNVMGLKKGNTTPKKTSVSDGLSAFNKLCIVIEKKNEDAFRQWIGSNRDIKICTDCRVSSGVMERAVKHFWSVMKLSDCPKDLKRQLNPKTGTVRFEHFADGLSLATALSEQADIPLPESVIKKLTPPPAPVQEDKKETTPMLRTDAIKESLPKWIFKRVEQQEDWTEVIKTLHADSRRHPEFKYFTLDEITEAAFEALVGTNKVPKGVLRACVHHYLKKNSIYPDPNSVALVQQVKDTLVDYGFHNPQDGIISGFLKEYVSANPAPEAAVTATARPEVVAPVFAPAVGLSSTPTNLKDFIRVNLAKDGSFTEECPTRDDLIAKAKAASISFKHSSFLATFSLVRRTLKNAAETGEEPTAQSLPSSNPQPEVKAAVVAQGESKETSHEPIVPEGKLTVRTLVLANLTPDGALPPWCKNIPEFYRFLSSAMPSPVYSPKSVENAIYNLRNAIKADALDVPKASALVPPVVEPKEEAKGQWEDGLDMPSPLVPQTSQDEEDTENGAGDDNLGDDQLGDERPEPPSHELELPGPSEEPKLDAEEESQFEAFVPESEELKAMRAKVRRARLLFDELDSNPQLLKLFFEFRDILPELNTLGEFFDRTPAE